MAEFPVGAPVEATRAQLEEQDIHRGTRGLVVENHGDGTLKVLWQNCSEASTNVNKNWVQIVQASTTDIIASDMAPHTKSITEALNAVNVGRFHKMHVVLMMFAWCAFGSSQEATPYTFPGLRNRFGASESQLGFFSSAFLFGGLLGSILASLIVDRVGRWPTMVTSSPVCCILHIYMAMAPSFEVLVILRVLQGTAWSLLMTAIATWYTEFLPTEERGALMAIYTLGWPVGRFLIIGIASVTDDAWQAVLLVGAFNFAILSVLIGFTSESPRFLMMSEDKKGAHRVLDGIYRQNGRVWDSSTNLTLDSHSCSHIQKITDRDHRPLLVFSFIVFASLSMTQNLLDTWGPDIYHELFSPKNKDLPAFILSLFDLGDMCGVVLSIFISDQVGRYGSFIIGFFVQSFMLVAMSATAVVIPSAVATLGVLFGMLSSSCRCFLFEAANMWTLEAFPTNLRALAFGLATAVMRLCGMGAVQIFSYFVGNMSAWQSILIIAFIMMFSGLVVLYMFPKETAGAHLGAPMNESSQTKNESEDRIHTLRESLL